MMRSMFSGVSGLRVHQTRMDVIADNVANVNTFGFKSSRVTFSDVFSQLVSGAAGPNPATGRGGVNAMQIGLGVGIASIDTIMTPGFAQRTDRSLDLMIDGSGFFIVGDASGLYFTRAGAFDVDPWGNIVDPRGMILHGWDVDANGNIQRTPVQPLNLHQGGKLSMDPAVTTEVIFSGNLNGATRPVHPQNITVFDSLGNRFVLDVELTMGNRDADGNTPWTVSFPANGTPGFGTPPQTANGVYMSLAGNPDQFVRLGDASDLAANAHIIWFDQGGRPINDATRSTTMLLGLNNIVGPAAGAAGAINPGATFGRPWVSSETVVFPAVPAAAPGANTGVISIDFSELTQHAASPSARQRVSNGNASGTLAEFTVGPDGIITGRYSNGLTRTLGQVPVARFANPGGLQKVGNNLFVPTPNSGDFDPTGEEVGADGGSIRGGALEMSNVDLANEFTSIITTQRGFQANSRIISTSDEMLQELVNLRR